jgi:hypothetical protein
VLRNAVTESLAKRGVTIAKAAGLSPAQAKQRYAPIAAR